jgi:hypothetical protein
MTTARFSCERSRQPFHLSAVFPSNFVGLLFVVLLTVSYAHAQQAAPSGEEVSYDRLGCWNCHGEAGRAVRHSLPIAKTRLPLRRFVGYVRLPNGTMPPYAPLLASDAELAIVYHWLDGIDAVRTPPAITVDLKISPEVGAEGQAKAEVEFEEAALRAETALKSDVPDLVSLSYRVTLITNVKAPVANQTLEYQLGGLEEWSKFTTDEHGEALLGPNRGFIAANAREKEKAQVRVRMALPAVRTVLVIEALDYTEPAKPVVVGIGTAIFKGQ